ncbi:MAG: transcriptional regulator [Elusimicrobia bacterium]|nr:transcriptional regulator [Elusimicrobiota bacterium]
MTVQTLEKRVSIPPFVEDNTIYTGLIRKYPPRPIESKQMHKDYSLLAGRLMALLEDDLPANDREGIERYLKVLIPLIRAFEAENYPAGKAEPEDVLRFFMEQHELKEVDLAKELGGQPVVSCILNGKRRLTRDQVKRLSRRFGVSEASFYPSGA